MCGVSFCVFACVCLSLNICVFFVYLCLSLLGSLCRSVSESIPLSLFMVVCLCVSFSVFGYVFLIALEVVHHHLTLIGAQVFTSVPDFVRE